MKAKQISGIIILTFLLILISCISVFLGAEKISPFDFFSSGEDSIERLIIFELRLPRIVLCILCGALLGGSGAVLQGFFRNPLADSGILGISSGATFGAIIYGFLPAASFSLKFLSPVSLFAFFGGLTAGLLVFFFSLIFKNSSSVAMLLSGTATGTFFSSLCSLMILLHDKDLHSVFAWTMGSFNAKGWEDVFFFLIPSVISLILLLFCAPSLDILGNGEKTARSLGLNIRSMKIFILLTGTLATSSAVCSGGIISFVGLIAPHVMRSIFGPKHRALIPLSMLAGSSFLLVSDIFARTVAAPSEIPIGIITSLVGVPFFIVVLKKDAYVHS